MNIVKKGHIYPYKGTCWSCGSDLECTKSELKTVLTLTNTAVEVSACPVCLERGQEKDVIFREK